MALPGLGPLQDSLEETNRLLAAVLAELQRTNKTELESIRAEVAKLAQHLGAPTRD